MEKPKLSIVARARDATTPCGLSRLLKMELVGLGRLLVVEEARVTWTSINSSSLMDTSPSSAASDMLCCAGESGRGLAVKNPVSTA